jgi:uncharacterized 2Fe-2S/4Fe-4S cluster protein (DUF4445 family)
MGFCGSCRLKIISGELSAPTDAELAIFSAKELAKGYRLACQARPGSDCTVEILPESMTTQQRIQLESLPISIQLKPTVKVYPIKVEPPTIDDQRADTERIFDALEEQYGVSYDRINIFTLRKLSSQLRSWDWQCQAVIRYGELVSIRPVKSTSLGLAIDLGTTKFAGYLVNLDTGYTLASRGMTNPQINYGGDVISRMAVAMDSANSARKIQETAIRTLNDMINNLCREAGTNRDDILDAVVVGNTAMCHLLLGLPVTQLSRSPYVPVIRSAHDISATDLKLRIAPGAYVHFLPNIAGFVGGDHIAMLLALRVLKINGPLIAIDIGTNTEMSLIKDDEITTVSCASGPAFEGGHIHDGMRATSGAIERVRIDGRKVYFQTIDNMPPVGICGSGVLDTLAQLYLTHIVDDKGRLANDHPFISEDKLLRKFIIVDKSQLDSGQDISVTQHDIREIQLAKAAIRTGIEILIKSQNVTLDSIREIIIAGAFGTYIDISSAITIGMLPPLPLNRFRQIGNAAGAGARLALLSDVQREEAKSLVSRVRYIELARIPDFMQTLTETMSLGVYRL